MPGIVRKFYEHVVPGVIKPLRVLWNEVIGFIFLAFAVLAGFQAFRAWRGFDGSADSLFRLTLAGLFCLIMGAFGVSSFVRARKISRS